MSAPSEFSKCSRVCTDEYEALVSIPDLSDTKTNSKVRVSIMLNYSESFPKPTVLTDEEFEELVKEVIKIMWTGYGRS